MPKIVKQKKRRYYYAFPKKRNRKRESKASKPFRFTAKTKAILGLARAMTNASASKITDACVHRVITRSAPQDVADRARSTAKADFEKLEAVLKREFPNKRGNPSSSALSKAVLRHVGVAAEAGGFSEIGIIEACIEREIASVVHDLVMEAGLLGSKATAAAFTEFLCGIGLEKSRHASAFRKTKRAMKSSQASADLVDPASTRSNRVLNIPGIGRVSTDDIAKLSSSGSELKKAH